MTKTKSADIQKLHRTRHTFHSLYHSWYVSTVTYVAANCPRTLRASPSADRSQKNGARTPHSWGGNNSPVRLNTARRAERGKRLYRKRPRSREGRAKQSSNRGRNVLHPHSVPSPHRLCNDGYGRKYSAWNRDTEKARAYGTITLATLRWTHRQLVCGDS